MNRYLALYLPLDDLRKLKHIAVWCMKLTPFVGVEEDLKKEELEKNITRRGLILDMTGMSRIYPDEEELGNKIFNFLSTAKVPGAIGISTTVGAAWALSRYSGKRFAVNGDKSLRDQLNSLPLECLRLNDSTIASINEVGLYSAGDLFSIPARQIGSRFGLNTLNRIDQALGRVEEPLRLLKFSESVFSIKRFNNPLFRRDSICHWVERLLENVFEKLRGKAVKASSFHLRFTQESKQIVVRNISLHLASESFSHVSSIVHSNIESIKFTDGIIIIQITALDLKSFDYGQVPAFREDGECKFDETKSFSELLNTVGAKIGADSIKQITFKESYVPERSCEFLPLEKQKKYEPIVCMLGRPSYILKKPEMVDVIAMLPDQPPSWFKWRGEGLRTVIGVGPERIHSEWWDSELEDAPLHRDYFRIQDEHGRWLWIYRDSMTLNWFVQGLWA